MKIHTLAAQSGLSVRTLQYYDKIGLLCPQRSKDNAYRLYTEQDILRLQQILFFRELGFSLSEIGEMLQNPHFDAKQAMEQQKALLLQKRQRLDNIISLLEQQLKGEQTMNLAAFDQSEIEKNKKALAEEAKTRWGQTEAYAAYEKRCQSDTALSAGELPDEGKQILSRLAALVGQAPDSAAVQDLTRQWQQMIDRHYYPCDKQMLCCLGQMYVGDARFAAYLDGYGDGTAALLAAAIAHYTK